MMFVMAFVFIVVSLFSTIGWAVNGDDELCVTHARWLCGVCSDARIKRRDLPPRTVGGLIARMLPGFWIARGLLAMGKCVGRVLNAPLAPSPDERFARVIDAPPTVRAFNDRPTESLAALRSSKGP